MPAWTSQAAYEAAFGAKELQQLTDRATPRAGAVDVAVCNAALDEAEGVVKGVIRRRYPTFPTPLIPAPVVAKTLHIARFYLFDKNVPESVRMNHNDALAFLDKAIFTPDELGLTAADDAGPKLASAPTKAVKYGSAFREQYDYFEPNR